jgi:methyltransferase
MVSLPTSAVIYGGLIVLLIGERMIEMVISRRNAAWAFERGGVEVGQRHFRWMKALHTAFIIGCAAEVVLAGRRFIPALGIAAFVAFAAAQILRYWAVTSLGRHWNVRVIVVPGAEAIRRGPYRFLRHPNYAAVVLEGIAFPLIHSAYLTAIVFAVLNAAVLYVRIRCEERALAEHCQYQERLGDLRRFLPGPPAAGAV